MHHIDNRTASEQALGDRVVFLDARGAVRRHLDQERREVAAARVDVRAPFREVVDHGAPTPIGGFPEHGAPVRTDSAQPVGLLRQRGRDGIEIAAASRRHADLQEVAGFAC